MDFYQEQYSYTLAQSTNVDRDSDEASSWVMLSRDGEVVKLPGEKIYYKVHSRIGLDISTPKALASATPFSVKSDSGIVYVTNSRVIYLPARPTDAFKSFSAPILDFEDTRVASSFFGPWSWNAIVKPTVGGGVPTDVPRLELKLIFKEGGHDAFQSKFEIMKERLAYARTLQQETGQIIPTGEDLPRYEATPSSPQIGPPGQTTTSSGVGLATTTTASAAAAATTAAAAATAAGTSPTASSPNPSNKDNFVALEPTHSIASGSGQSFSPGSISGNQVSQVTPDEPPPDYEEAQAQAVGMRLEENLRKAANQQ